VPLERALEGISFECTRLCVWTRLLKLVDILEYLMESYNIREMCLECLCWLVESVSWGYVCKSIAQTWLFCQRGGVNLKQFIGKSKPW